MEIQVTAHGWTRAGIKIRQTRTELGYTNRDSFAQRCGVSTRLISDIEAGARTNFKRSGLTRLEAGLGWSEGSIHQLVADPTFEPIPTPTGVWRPPVFDRNPVAVDVATIELAIAALTKARLICGGKPGPVETVLAAGMVGTCRPYVIRVLEDNWSPTDGLHPAALPVYTAFAELANWAAPGSVDRYAQWLAGTAKGGAPEERSQHLERWAASRRTPSRKPARLSAPDKKLAS